MSSAHHTGGVGEFRSEAEMVRQFVSALQSRQSSFGEVEVTSEWDHRAGFVDVLARDRNKMLIAFEAKLDDWKRAFAQAYRNTAYADRAFVLLPAKPANRALAHRALFEDKGIGLCSFDGEQINVLLDSSRHQPLTAWITTRAHEHFDEQESRTGDGTRCGCHRGMLATRPRSRQNTGLGLVQARVPCPQRE